MKNLPSVGQRDSARCSNQGRLPVLAFLALLTFVGCKCPDPQRQRQEDLARLPQGAGSLQDQLAAESAGRPRETGTLEALIAALTKDNISFNAPRQGFGKKLLASYCASADSSDGMIVTVCEYPTPEQAKRGEAEARLVGSLTAGYQSKVSKKSVLQVVARSTTPPEHVAKVLSIFDAL